MKQDTDKLADVVMNALWFSGTYCPTHALGKEQPDEEISAGKLARKSVTITLSVFLVSFHAAN